MRIGDALSEWETFYVLFPRVTKAGKIIFLDWCKRRRVYNGMATNEFGSFNTYKWEYIAL